MNEAFVYKWTNDIGRVYLGYHKGTPDDGYVSSSLSNEFWEDYKNPNIAWKREIIAFGSIRDMVLLEKEILDENKDAIVSGEWYNNTTNSGIIFTKEVRKKISVANKGKPSPNKGNRQNRLCCLFCRGEFGVGNFHLHLNRKIKCNEQKPKKEDSRKNLTREHKEKISKALLGKIKSAESIQRMKSAIRPPIKPHVYEAAKLASSKYSKGKIFINDGYSNRRIDKNEEIPNGWKRGRYQYS
jgi:hypothetical protein